MNQPTYQPTYFLIGASNRKIKYVLTFVSSITLTLIKGWLVGWLVTLVIMIVAKFKKTIENARILDIIELDLKIMKQPTFWLEYGTGWLVG